MPERTSSGQRRGPPARVVRGDANRVVVEVVPAGVCAGCELRGGCAGLRLTTESEPLTVEAVNRCGAVSGEDVEVQLPRGGISVSAALIYLLPAAAILAGAVLGSGPGAGILGCSAELGAMAGVGVALLVVVGLLALIDPSVSGLRRLRLEAVAARDAARVK